MSDITSATSPDFSDVQEWKKYSIKKIQEVDEDLDAFTSKGNEVDVGEIMHQIETVMSKARTSKGKARFAEFPGASKISELSELMAYNEGKQNVDGTISKEEDNLENKSISEIEQMHAKELARLNVDGKDEQLLNEILQEHKNGNINRLEYLSLMEEYSTNSRFSEKTIADLKSFGITVLTTNNMGIVDGIKHFSKEGKAVADKVARGFGTVLKGGTYAVGFTYGMYDDLSNNDKTVGEAVAHNGTSLGVGIGATTIATVSTALIMGVGLATAAPVVAGLVVGAGVGLLFEVAYNRNWGKLQTGLDKVGEAVSSGLSKLIPKKWAW